MELASGLKGCKHTWTGDIVAGFVVAALTIPLAMGYAQIAGLPAEYGLYASVFPTLAFALLTKSRTLYVGLDSATVAATGSVVASAGIAASSEEALAFVPLLTLATAAFMLLFSAFKLGRLMRFIPASVMQGFITGISIVVIVGQIPQIAGISVPVTANFASRIGDVAAALPQTSVASAAVGIAALAIILACEKRFPKVPISLLTLIVFTIAATLLRVDQLGVQVLGALPVGLPSVFIPTPEMLANVNWINVIAGGLVVAFVASSESLLTFNVFTMKKGQRGDDDHELFCFGAANIVAALAGTTTCSACLSRTAAAEKSGSCSQLSSVVAALIILLVVAFLSPTLYYLPRPVLGAIVVAAMLGLVNTHKLSRYARDRRLEFAIYLATALIVMFVGTLQGVLAGVALSFITLEIRTRRTQGEKRFGLVTSVDIPDVPEVPANTLVLTLPAQTSFRTIGKVEDQLFELVGQPHERIIIDLSKVDVLDATAADRLVDLVGLLRNQGQRIRLVRPVVLSHDHYSRLEMRRMFGKMKSFPSIDAAIAHLPQDELEEVEIFPDGTMVEKRPSAIYGTRS